MGRELLLKDFHSYGKDVLESDEYAVLDTYVQHGNINCLQHSVGVAVFSLAFVRRFGIRCDERALVRGALLHDYFLYDWHEKKVMHTWHGFTHARAALRNASRDFLLTKKEKEIIRAHMWPLNPVPPKVREAWVVTLIDKYCSALEVLGQIPILRFLENMVVNASI